MFQKKNVRHAPAELIRVQRVLLQLREQAESTGIEFRIMNVTRLIQQVLEITKLNRVFGVTCERDLLSLTPRFGHESVQPARVEYSFSEASEPDVTEAAFAFDASTSRS